MEQRALQTKLDIERYVGEQIVGLHVLALDPEVIRAVGAKEIPRAEHPLGARLREIIQIRPNLKLLQIVDAQGRVVAASSRGARVIPFGAPWVETLLGQDASVRPYVGDIQRTPGTGDAVLEIAYPIRAVQGPPQGIVRALVDAADLFGVLASVRIGRTGHAVLVRAEDGLILASDEQPKVLRDHFPGFATVQAAMREKRGYWLVPAVSERTDDGKTLPGEPARLVGFALVEQVPDVNWLVTVEQDHEEATFPLTGVSRYLWLHFALVLGAVLLLALYFSFKLDVPVIEERLHLHDEHVPASMREPTP